MNSYIGAWVTAGVAVGGILFEVIRSIVTSVVNWKINKNNNETKIKILKLQNKQKSMQILDTERHYIRQAFGNYCGYTAALLNSNGKLYIDEQAKAFGNIIMCLQGTQGVVSFVQSEINKDHYDNALLNFNNVLSNLREEERSLLSQLEQHSPKDCKDDSED